MSKMVVGAGREVGVGDVSEDKHPVRTNTSTSIGNKESFRIVVSAGKDMKAIVPESKGRDWRLGGNTDEANLGLIKEIRGKLNRVGAWICFLSFFSNSQILK
jgi:hypothetical protein